ncbi:MULTISPECIES: DUF669 domain-containing protein [Lentilactobacillus]|uniref:Single-stranded DNA-binding protein n=2 Tax=Lentilactobacillus TaxID=2767893 RepID=A0A0R1Z147_9LACO|nr:MULTISPECIES: DUF669 domain-containing protein [Lentilactobacillus]KRM08569.1 hypothetical protein FD41_GL000127 [Lentilactobacillus farraginis DSM 18382 = JCM 14108]KRM45257.1 hypothetical protein FD47_GL002156 [Lentilactobacillus parafarraginis DSM 18390 = JCM 14109]GAF37604.1 single-stranded DNA-binding protein [Lentilactobacillus farraginis DSM 18382 = JCM 14108]
MAFITTDYSNNEHQTYGALPTGTYEMVIKSAQEKATPSGAESLQLDLVVRNDLNGVKALANTNAKYQNRHVFMDNWKRKKTNQYDTKSFQYILEAVGIPEGQPINSIEDFTKAIANRPAKVYVKKGVDDYNGEKKDVNQVAPWNFEKSDFPKVAHVWKDQKNGNNPFAENSEPQNNAPAANNDPFANSGDSIDISDDDLPF